MLLIQTVMTELLPRKRKPEPKKIEIQAVYRQFGAKVESMRMALELTQGELAKRVKLGRTSVVNIEAGKQRVLLADVERFAAALGVSPKSMMRGIWL